MLHPFQKGDLLENAVIAIEETILQDSPGLNQNAFRIESKKLLFSDGVKHEIDVWVTVDIGKGYDAIFIFECKNWEDKVGKNEIIIFSEKISVAKAQKGFFVAKSFTKDAIAQAAKDHRIQVLTAADLPTVNVTIPFGLHYAIAEPSNIELVFKDHASGNTELPSTRIKVQEVVLRGESLNIQDLSQKWADQVWGERAKTFASVTLPEGVYPVMIEGEMRFQSNELAAEGHNIELVLYKCTFNVRVARPAIISYFSVEGRGRVIQLAPVQLGADGLIYGTLISTDL
jgi:hypothetical protein